MIQKDYTYNDPKKSACHHLADDEEFVRQLVQETLNGVRAGERGDGVFGSWQERTDEDASGLPFWILSAQSDDEGGRDRTESSTGTQRQSICFFQRLRI